MVSASQPIYLRVITFRQILPPFFSDFNLYVFHPFGRGSKKRPEDMLYSPLSSEERKDSLSVNVAFVQFHMSRSRRVNFEASVKAGSSVDNSGWNNTGNSFNGGPSHLNLMQFFTNVRFSN